MLAAGALCSFFFFFFKGFRTNGLHPLDDAAPCANNIAVSSLPRKQKDPPVVLQLLLSAVGERGVGWQRQHLEPAGSSSSSPAARCPPDTLRAAPRWHCCRSDDNIYNPF